MRFDAPVISIGNITVGGVGKSPVVAWIVDHLRARDLVPLIAMRGYGAAGDQMSDEHAEYVERFPDVPVVAQPDRVAGIREALQRGTHVDCIVLDDGFQHRRIDRDLDLVLIDATRPGLHGRLLPDGWLREPAASVRRADAVLVTRAPDVLPRLSSLVESNHGRSPIAWCTHAWAELDVWIDAEASTAEPVTWLDGRRVVTMLGVGNPEAVREHARATGAVIVADIPARDHHRFDEAILRRAIDAVPEGGAILITPKDWVKVRALLDSFPSHPPIVVPAVRIDVHHGADDLISLIDRTVTPPDRRGSAHE